MQHAIGTENFSEGQQFASCNYQALPVLNDLDPVASEEFENDGNTASGL